MITPVTVLTGFLGSGTAAHSGITSFEWSAAEPLPWAGVERALDTIIKRLGERLLRMKGLVQVEDEPGPRSTRLVFIGRGLEDAAVTPILESMRA